MRFTGDGGHWRFRSRHLWTSRSAMRGRYPDERRVRVRLAGLALALGVAAGCLAAPPATASGAEPDGAVPYARWLVLRDQLLTLQRDARVPALVLVVLDQGRVALLHADARAGSTGFTANSPFRWGSITKSVTALTALEAARRAGLGLDVPVRPLLRPLLRAPAYHNPWAAHAPLRLVHLLELSAGLTDLSAAEFADNTPRPLTRALARHPRELLWPPGLQHSYSNVPPGLTAAVVTVLTGTSFEAAARELVLGPLGMAGAGFRPVPGLPGGYRADGRTRIPYWHMTFRAFGGLNASAREMARLLEALLNAGEVDGRQAVAAASVARMFELRGSLGARAGLDIGYGAGVYGWVRDGHLFHGHGGDADGYRSRFGLLRQARRGYLLGINVDDPALLRRMQRLTEQALVAGLAPPRPPPRQAVSPARLARYAGAYYPASARFQVERWRAGEATRARVSVTPPDLLFRRSGRAVRLIPLGAGRFRRSGDPGASVVFVEHGGALHLQGELGNFTRTGQ